MAKKKEVKRASPAEISHAEWLFCEKRWTPEAIAEALSRDIKTIYSWRDKNNWEEIRSLFDTGPTELKRILLQEAIKISKGEKGTVDADSLSKVMKAYDYMSKRASPEVISDVFMEFDNFMVTIDPKTANEFTKYHKMFLQHKISLES